MSSFGRRACAFVAVAGVASAIVLLSYASSQPRARAPEDTRAQPPTLENHPPPPLAPIEERPKPPTKNTEIDPLRSLAATDLRAEPDDAPSIIMSVAKLGRDGGPADRRLATTMLARWLREESRRNDPDAIGNVPNLIEALGTIEGRESVDALIATLEDVDAHHDLAAQTLIVQQLAKLGDPRARAAVERFSERANQSTAAAADEDDFDRQLRDEAIAEARGALARLVMP